MDLSLYSYLSKSEYGIVDFGILHLFSLGLFLMDTSSRLSIDIWFSLGAGRLCQGTLFFEVRVEYFFPLEPFHEYSAFS